ncbi:hypothetical protein [Streptomyces sp. NPDC005407]|uniref:hypothetical protein n=1 Tax=Streptomyces sp. NPDC005407 TaxID=3155340 RepID=UPI0033AA2931
MASLLGVVAGVVPASHPLYERLPAGSTPDAAGPEEFFARRGGTGHADTVYRGSERAAGLGWVTGVGRTGAVVGPWLGGVFAAGGNESWGFTTFALTGLLGATAIAFVPLAARLGGRRSTAAGASTVSASPATGR